MEHALALNDPAVLTNCRLCPRRCGVDRFAGAPGYCRSDAGIHIGAICRHQGEEPVLGGPAGICNVFFTHCNLQCGYCQNYQISRNHINRPGSAMTLDAAVVRICAVLDQGINTLGFVAPSHQIFQMAQIIQELHRRGRYPVVVYNTSAYDCCTSLQALDDLVDIYLPDFKYLDTSLAEQLSGAKDYAAVATQAVAAMLRQKGSALALDEQGVARRGVIIRHLVLPGHSAQTIAVLAYIARTFSTQVAVSLMAQYYPTPSMRQHPLLGRKLTRREYKRAVAALMDCGFENGWVQELSAAECCQPDFKRAHPF